MHGRGRFIGRRLLSSSIVMVVILTLVFVMTRMVGDPARLMTPLEAPESVYLQRRAEMGLDAPLWQQFLREMSRWVRADFGDSLWQRVPALGLVLDRLPATLMLTAATLALALPVALLLGFVSALRPGSLVDKLVTGISLAAVSIVDFWIALTLILIVAVRLGWLPTSGSGGIEYVILPAVTLALRPMGRLAQIFRSSLLDELSKPYVVTARARGLTDSQILLRHAFRNASLPTITMAGDEMAALINGAVVVETIFGWPGVGSLFIRAIELRDLPLVIACVFVVAVTVIVINLAVDLCYMKLNPQIRLA